jgi:general stress protein YciG
MSTDIAYSHVEFGGVPVLPLVIGPRRDPSGVEQQLREFAAAEQSRLMEPLWLSGPLRQTAALKLVDAAWNHVIIPDQPTVNVTIYHSSGLYEATAGVLRTLRALSSKSQVLYRPFIWPHQPRKRHACVCLLWHNLPVVLSGWYWPDEWWHFEEPDVLVFFQKRAGDVPTRLDMDSIVAKGFFRDVLGLSTERPIGKSVGSHANFQKPLVEYLTARAEWPRKTRRGFASMSPEKQREIASKSGRAAHRKGTAHEWSADEARDAGRKGGMASRGRRVPLSEPKGALPEEEGVLETAISLGGFAIVTPAERDISTTVSQARFAAFAPNTVEPGRTFLLEVWVASSEKYDEMVKLACHDGDISQRGSKVTVAPSLGSVFDVVVDLPGFRAEQATDSLLWVGEPTNASFVMTPIPDIPLGWHVGTATIALGSVPFSRLGFRIQVGQSTTDARQVSTHEQPLEKIFASYASADRDDVMQWARGAEHLGRSRVFIDVMSLRQGADWESELFRVVPASDLFCLFWSAAAKRSAWVDKEWRCALAARGLEYIHPVPLEDPRDVPPPSELTARHFADPMFFVQLYERFRRSQKRADDGPRRD